MKEWWWEACKYDKNLIITSAFFPLHIFLPQKLRWRDASLPHFSFFCPYSRGEKESGKGAFFHFFWGGGCGSVCALKKDKVITLKKGASLRNPPRDLKMLGEGEVGKGELSSGGWG